MATDKTPGEKLASDGVVSLSPRWFDTAVAGWTVAGYGLLLLIVAVIHDAPDEFTPSAVFLTFFQTILIAIPAASVVYGGYWLASGSFEPAHQQRVLNWVGWGSLAVASIAAGGGLYLFWIGYPPNEIEFVFLLSLATGAAAGLLFGIKTERVRRHARSVETQRDTLHFLNRLLRHHVLNGMNVIQGYSNEALSTLDGEAREDFEPVRVESERIVEVIENVRTLIDALVEETRTHPVSLATELENELTAFRERYPHVEMEVRMPTEVYVEANELLNIVIEHLLRTAAERCDGSSPAVSVDVETDESTATMTVADTGEPIPDPPKGAALRRGEYGEAGMNLWLVNELVMEYDGSLTITNGEADRTVITVEFPIAEPPR